MAEQLEANERNQTKFCDEDMSISGWPHSTGGTREESGKQSKSSAPDTLAQVLQFLRKNGLQEAEKSLLKEASTKGIPFGEDQVVVRVGPSTSSSQESLGNLLSSHQSDNNDPSVYMKDYQSLIDLVENSSDRVKVPTVYIEIVEGMCEYIEAAIFTTSTHHSDYKKTHETRKSDKMKIDKKAASKEYPKRVKLSPDNLPSICMYTFLNAHGGVCCCDMSEDSSVLAAGYGNSTVQIFSLLPEKKLKPLKNAQELELLDKDSEDINVEMLDEERGKSNLTFTGHSGPVYGVSISPDVRTVLSASEDSTVRLWSLETWTNLVVYRIGGYPIWDVSFSPRGYYFASGGGDRVALLWSTDKLQPFRIFAGHSSDVNCVKFHPNCNYLLTGSDDRSVRVFDVLNGQCVRLLNGHKGGVLSVQWSPDGRYIASGGGMDNAVRLFHLPSLTADSKSNEASTSSSTEPKLNVPGFETGTYRTKSTPLLYLHFTRRNLLLGVGSFDQ